jgi:hypothetical protein
MLTGESQIGTTDRHEPAFGIGFECGGVVAGHCELREGARTNRGEDLILVLEIAIGGRTATAQLIRETTQAHTCNPEFSESPRRDVTQAAAKDIDLIFAQGKSTHRTRVSNKIATVNSIVI